MEFFIRKGNRQIPCRTQDISQSCPSSIRTQLFTYFRFQYWFIIIIGLSIGVCVDVVCRLLMFTFVFTLCLHMFTCLQFFNFLHIQVLNKSFAELDIFTENTTDVVWNLVSNFKQRPYETTMEAFSKLTDIGKLSASFFIILNKQANIETLNIWTNRKKKQPYWKLTFYNLVIVTLKSEVCLRFQCTTVTKVWTANAMYPKKLLICWVKVWVL